MPQITQVLRKGLKKSGSRVCSLNAPVRTGCSVLGVGAGAQGWCEGLSLVGELRCEAEQLCGKAEEGVGRGSGHACFTLGGACCRHSPHTLSSLMSQMLYFSPESSWFPASLAALQRLHILNVSQLNIITRKSYSI